MKLLSLITAALLPLTALAAKKPTGDLFQKYPLHIAVPAASITPDAVNPLQAAQTPVYKHGETVPVLQLSSFFPGPTESGGTGW